jgi:hypothetical protein
MASELEQLKRHGPGALDAYLRNARLTLLGHVRQVFVEGRALAHERSTEARR